MLTTIFTFMPKPACRIKCIGAEIIIAGMRADASVFSKRILEMIPMTLSNRSAATEARGRSQACLQALSQGKSNLDTCHSVVYTYCNQKLIQCWFSIPADCF